MRTIMGKSIPAATSFMVPFAALCSAFLAAAALAPEALTVRLGLLDAHLAVSLLGMFGMFPTAHRLIINLDGASIELSRECSSLLLAAPFCAFVLAVTATPRQKIAGLIAGIPALFAANVLRICAILIAGTHSHDLMVYTHSFFGQIAMVLLVLTACLTWMSWTGYIPQSRSAARFAGRALFFSLVLSTAWFSAGVRYAQGVVSLACMGLDVLGFGVFHPDMTQVGLGAVNAFGPLLLCALILASPDMRFGRRVSALAAGTGALTLLLTVQEMAEALIFGMEPARVPWWFTISAAIQQIPLPVLLWHVFGGRIDADHVRCPEPLHRR